MKRKFFACLVICVFALSGMALAGQGKGVMDGTGPQTQLLDGEPVTIAGEVVPGASAGGVVIDNGEGVLATVYGFGPDRYWDLHELDKPVIGDLVSIEAREVTLSDDTTRIVAFVVTYTDSLETIALRDLETCVPLWRQLKGQKQQRLNRPSDQQGPFSLKSQRGQTLQKRQNCSLDVEE
ncbi:MAG: hypothetical protein ACMUIP_11465 [bacterium]